MPSILLITLLSSLNTLALPVIGQEDPVATMNTLQGPPAVQCKLNAALRTDCGFPGITNQQCTALGCCFDETDPIGPFCFQPDLTIQPALALPKEADPLRDAVCTFNELFRIACGGNGLNEQQCMNRGCCFNPNSQVPCSYAFVPVKPNQVAGVGNVVLGQGNQVAGVNNGVLGVQNQVAGAQNGVLGVQNQVAGAMNGVKGVQNQAAGAANAVVGANNQVAGLGNKVYGQGLQVAGQNVNIPNAPLKANGVCNVNIPALQRIDCGFDGITQQECTAKGCCWGVLPLGTVGPVCFE